MKKHLFFFALLLLFGTQTKAQQLDTITAIYTDTIYSGYVSSLCTGGGCIYNLPVVLPPGFTIVDIKTSFTYRTFSPCLLTQGAYIVSLGSCKTYCNTCELPAQGGCITMNKSFYDSLKECLPAPSCVSDTINFVLDLFRNAGQGGGCVLSCINGDGSWTINVIGSIDTCTTSVTEHLNMNSVITISPNPATNQLIIHASSLHSAKPATVFITNVLGQNVSTPLNVRRSLSKVEVDVSKLSAGMYFLEMKWEGGSSVKRFVKE